MADAEQPFKSVAILGLGLLGGSIAKSLRARHRSTAVIGWSQRESTRALAQAQGVVDVTVETPEQAVADADLVVLCTPVSSIKSTIKSLAPHIRRDAVVTDVGSTKRSIVEAGESALNGGASFVGAHPMAGGEKSGLAAARDDLFAGALCILTPTEKTRAEPLLRVEEFWQSLGCRTTRLGPAEHDRLLSDVSHAPHAIAAALVAMQDEKALPLAGPGFRDTTRIASGDPELWRDIFLDNRDAACRSIDRCVAWLRDFRTALQAGDGTKIEQMLAAAAKRRRGM